MVLKAEIHRTRDACGRMGGAGASYAIVHTADGDYNAIELSFRDRRIGDPECRELHGLSGVVGLDLSGTEITDAALVYVATMKDLKYVQLARTRVSDAGIQLLCALKDLEALDVSWTKVSREARPYLETLPRLRKVYAAGTSVLPFGEVEVDATNIPDGWLRKRTRWQGRREW
jgi:hypothetical protein